MIEGILIESKAPGEIMIGGETQRADLRSTPSWHLPCVLRYFTYRRLASTPDMGVSQQILRPRQASDLPHSLPESRSGGLGTL